MHSARTPMKRLSTAALAFAVAALAAGAVAAQTESAGQAGNDYPTAARADYVLGCMAANNNTRQALIQCSCAIDTIAQLMPYAEYEMAETALSMQAGGGVGGDRAALFRDPPEVRLVLQHLREAQAEADLQCFR